jgi:type II secretory pathway component PulF
MPKNTSINTLEKFWTNLKKPNEDVKTNFFRLLSLGQRAGLGMRDSLVALQASEKNIEMRAIIEDMINKISEGASLGVAMGNHSYLFSTEEREMIVSAESIGSLPETLERIALDLEQFQKIRRKIKGAMTYPVVLILITIGAVIVLLIFVMPTIVDLFPSVDDLPYITKLMLSVSDYLKKNRFFLIAGIGALV